MVNEAIPVEFWDDLLFDCFFVKSEVLLKHLIDFFVSEELREILKVEEDDSTLFHSSDSAFSLYEMLEISFAYCPDQLNHFLVAEQLLLSNRP